MKSSGRGLQVKVDSLKNGCSIPSIDLTEIQVIEPGVTLVI